jgi:hypothetical protein
MLGNPSFRELEYTALMDRARDLARTSSTNWTWSAIASAGFLAWAIGSQNPGLLLPAVMCAACGYYVTLNARRETLLLEGYIQETFEGETTQWHTRRGQVSSLPGSDQGQLGLPLAQAQLVALLSVVLAWVFAKGAVHGELLAGLTTAVGVAFGLHSVTEHLRYGQVTSAAYWAHVTGGPREVRVSKVRKMAA